MSDSTTDDGDGRAVNTDDGGDVLEKDLDERAEPAGERLVRGAADSVAALDGAGAARARGAAVSWHGEGGGDRKEARDGGGNSELGEHLEGLYVVRVSKEWWAIEWIGWRAERLRNVGS